MSNTKEVFVSSTFNDFKYTDAADSVEFCSAILRFLSASLRVASMARIDADNFYSLDCWIIFINWPNSKGPTIGPNGTKMKISYRGPKLKIAKNLNWKIEPNWAKNWNWSNSTKIAEITENGQKLLELSYPGYAGREIGFIFEENQNGKKGQRA